MLGDMTTVTALWWAVIFSGLYHGINPGMGWPLAVSAALMERKHSAMPKALAMLAAGHFLAMIGILLPFSLMIFLFEWEIQIRVGAGLLVIAMGIYLLINRRHPKVLARIHPARLALWSFLAAMAHGAALMLVPIFLGMCAVGADDTGHVAGFCRKLRLCMESLLSPDTVIQRAPKIAGKQIVRVFRIVSCGSCARLQCHPVLRRLRGRI